jgi:hypothetical protein
MEAQDTSPIVPSFDNVDQIAIEHTGTVKSARKWHGLQFAPCVGLYIEFED